MKNTILYLFVFGSLVFILQFKAEAKASPSQANSCACKYTQGNAKQLQREANHWWGSEYDYYCDYDCTSATTSEKVRGNHKIWFLGDEEGNEYICEGTIYKERYSSSSNWFYYDYIGSKSFSPQKSKSPEIRQWAKANCQ